MIRYVLRVLGGSFGTVALYGAVAAFVLLATTAGGEWLWIGHLDRVIAELQGDLQTEKTGRLADRTTAAEAARRQEAAHRATEQRWAAQQEEVNHVAETKIAAARADAAAASAAAGRLSGRLAALGAAARRAPSGAPAPAECAPAIAAVDLQADVLRRLVDRGRELAEYADASRVAGEACFGAWPTTTKVNP